MKDWGVNETTTLLCQALCDGVPEIKNTTTTFFETVLHPHIPKLVVCSGTPYTIFCSVTVQEKCKRSFALHCGEAFRHTRFK